MTVKLRKGKKSIAQTHPHLLGEWHPTKNKGIEPSQFSAGSERKRNALKVMGGVAESVIVPFTIMVAQLVQIS